MHFNPQNVAGRTRPRFLGIVSQGVPGPPTLAQSVIFEESLRSFFLSRTKNSIRVHDFNEFA